MKIPELLQRSESMRRANAKRKEGLHKFTSRMSSKERQAAIKELELIQLEFDKELPKTKQPKKGK